MVVGIAKVVLYLPACHSLKEKRKVLRKLKDRTLSRFKVQVAEVDANDKWQRSEMGFSVVGNDRRVLQSVIDKVFNFIAENHEVQIVEEYSELMNI